MTSRITSVRFADIIEAIDHIRTILSTTTADSFAGVWQKRRRIERGIEIISEASRYIADEIKATHPEIPWTKVAGIGNVLRHGYDRIAPDILWKLAEKDLSALYDVCSVEYQAALSRQQEAEPGQPR